LNDVILSFLQIVKRRGVRVADSASPEMNQEAHDVQVIHQRNYHRLDETPGTPRRDHDLRE
jgi:hypothetical protein